MKVKYDYFKYGFYLLICFYAFLSFDPGYYNFPRHIMTLGRMVVQGAIFIGLIWLVIDFVFALFRKLNRKGLLIHILGLFILIVIEFYLKSLSN